MSRSMSRKSSRSLFSHKKQELPDSDLMTCLQILQADNIEPKTISNSSSMKSISSSDSLSSTDEIDRNLRLIRKINNNMNKIDESKILLLMNSCSKIDYDIIVSLIEENKM